jgi:UDPglucose 6-dehydrogenase
MGYDRRIGQSSMSPGPGWGGSCLPKDTEAMLQVADFADYEFRLLRATIDTNTRQRQRMVEKVRKAVTGQKGGSLSHVRLAVLGLTFKAGTDDLRDSPALDVIERLHGAGAVVSAYDPVVKQVPAPLSDALRIAVDAYDAAERADAVVVATEWPDFAVLDLPRLAAAMHGALVVDGRGILNPDAATAAGLTLCGFGW